MPAIFRNWLRPGSSTAAWVLCGVLVGWSLGSSSPKSLVAGGTDRAQESALTSGPVFIRYNEGTRVQVAQDAVYFLDYRAGKLIGAIPSIRQTAGRSKIIESFAERDLVADFGLDLDTGPNPHFLMTTGSVSAGSGSTFSDGGTSLFIFETTSRKVAAYKISQLIVGTSQTVRLDLLEIRPFAASTALGPAGLR